MDFGLFYHCQGRGVPGEFTKLGLSFDEAPAMTEELVRDALVRAYGAGADEREATLRAIEGLWRNRTDIGDTSGYVKRLRRDTHRLRRLRRP